MAPERVSMEPAAVVAEPGAALRAIRAGGVVHVPGWWGPARARDALDAVLGASDRWVSDFGAKQYALGRAWYTHLETDRTAEYFREAAAANAVVESVVPGLQDDLRGVLGAIVGAPVVHRSRWAGAGVHVFPPHGVCARVGGCVHFDHEGLTPAQRGARSGALSLVLMLGPAEAGGGLRLWDVWYGEPEVAVGEPLEIVSQAGDLVVFDSHRLHQIQPFDGERPRVSATVHGAELPGRWESWF